MRAYFTIINNCFICNEKGVFQLNNTFIKKEKTIEYTIRDKLFWGEYK